MMRLQSERALVIQNRPTKITGTKVSVAEIVKHICGPLSGTNERLVTGDSLLKMAAGVFFVCLRKLDVRLRVQRSNQEDKSKRTCRNIDFQSVCPAGLKPAGSPAAEKISSGRTGSPQRVRPVA